MFLGGVGPADPTDSERVFAVVNWDNLGVSGGGDERNFVGMLTCGPSGGPPYPLPLTSDTLQPGPNKMARARGLVALGPDWVLVLEDFGRVVEVVRDPANPGTWSATSAGDLNEPLSFWASPGSQGSPQAVNYVAGLNASSILLLVGHVPGSSSSPPSPLHVIVGRVPLELGTGAPHLDQLSTGDLGDVGVPLLCDQVSGCPWPRLGIYDAGFEFKSGAMMLVGATRATTGDCARLLRVVRLPAPPAEPAGL